MSQDPADVYRRIAAGERLGAPPPATDEFAAQGTGQNKPGPAAGEVQGFMQGLMGAGSPSADPNSVYRQIAAGDRTESSAPKPAPTAAPAPNPYHQIAAGDRSASNSAAPDSGYPTGAGDLHGIAADAARRHGVPVPLFLAQIQQESGFRRNLTSPKGAQGIAQFMPATARGMGLTDPFNAEAALDKAAQLMAQNFKQYGKWDLALAAYNGGPRAVRNGRVWNVPETQNYVASIMGKANHYPAGTAAQYGATYGPPSPPRPAPPYRGPYQAQEAPPHGGIPLPPVGAMPAGRGAEPIIRQQEAVAGPNVYNPVVGHAVQPPSPLERAADVATSFPFIGAKEMHTASLATYRGLQGQGKVPLFPQVPGIDQPQARQGAIRQLQQLQLQLESAAASIKNPAAFTSGAVLDYLKNPVIGKPQTLTVYQRQNLDSLVAWQRFRMRQDPLETSQMAKDAATAGATELVLGGAGALAEKPIAAAGQLVRRFAPGVAEAAGNLAKQPIAQAAGRVVAGAGHAGAFGAIQGPTTYAQVNQHATPGQLLQASGATAANYALFSGAVGVFGEALGASVGRLLGTGRPVLTAEIARQTGADAGTIADGLAKLEQNGQVERTPTGWRAARARNGQRVTVTPDRLQPVGPTPVRMDAGPTPHDQALTAQEQLRQQNLAEPPPGATAPRAAPPGTVQTEYGPIAVPKASVPVERVAPSSVPVWDPAWTTLDGKDVLQIPGSKVAAVPITGNRNAATFQAFDVETREPLTQLKKSEVRDWLIQHARGADVPPTGRINPATAGKPLAAEGESHYLFLERNGKRLPVAGPYPDQASAQADSFRVSSELDKVDPRSHFDPIVYGKTSDAGAKARYDQFIEERAKTGRAVRPTAPPTAPEPPAGQNVPPEPQARAGEAQGAPASIPAAEPAAEPHPINYQPRAPGGTPEGGQVTGPPEYPAGHPKAEPPTPNETGINARITAQEIDAGRLQHAPEVSRGMNRKEALARGRKVLADQGENAIPHAEDIARTADREKRPFDRRELGVVLAANERLARESDRLGDALEKLPPDHPDRPDTLRKYEAAGKRYQEFRDLSHTGLGEAGGTLGLSRGGVDLNTGSITDIRREVRRVAGRELKPGAETEAFAKLAEQNKALQEEHAKLQAHVEERAAAHAEELKALQAEHAANTAQAVGKTRRVGQRSNILKERAAIHAEIDKILKETASKLHSVGSAAYDSARFLYAAGRLALNHVKEKGLDFADAAEQVIRDLKEKGLTVTRADVARDIWELTQPTPGKPRTPAQKAYTAAVAQAVKEAGGRGTQGAEPGRTITRQQAAEARKAGMAAGAEPAASFRAAEVREKQLQKQLADMKSGVTRTPPEKRAPFNDRIAGMERELATLREERKAARADQAAQESLDKIRKRIGDLSAGAPARERLYRTPDAERAALKKEEARLEKAAAERDLPDWYVKRKADVRAAADAKAQETLAELDRKLRVNDLTPLPKKARADLTDAQQHVQALLRIRRQELLSRIDAAKPLTPLQRFGKAVMGVTDFIRGTLLGGDVGVLGRQGFFALPGHPGLYARAVAKAVRASGTEVGLARLLNEIEGRTVNGRSVLVAMKRAKLQVGGDRLSPQEEFVFAHAFSKIPGKIGEKAGILERFQKGFLPSIRADIFTQGMEDGFSDTELRSLAGFQNSATGRSNAKSLPAWLRIFMTSPRYEISRWELGIEPAKALVDLGRGVSERKINRGALRNLKDMAASAAMVASMVGLARLAGYKFNMNDSDQADFFKLRKGNDVWDILPGISPRLRDVVRLASDFTHPGYGKTLTDVAGKTLTRTISPGVRTPLEQASIGIQRARGTQQPKSFFTGYSEEGEMQGWAALLNMTIQAGVQAQQQEGPGAAAWAAGREFAGFNVSRYPPKAGKALAPQKSANPWGGSSNPWR